MFFESHLFFCHNDPFLPISLGIDTDESNFTPNITPNNFG